MQILPIKRIIILLIVITYLPILALGQYKDFRKLHTQNFDANKWSSGAAAYYENGYPKYAIKDLGKGREKQYAYYDNGTLLSVMEVVFKYSMDTIATFSPETYEEVVQITRNKEIVPDGPYIEYHKGEPNGKKLIHLKGKFRAGKKIGTWTRTDIAGKTSKVTVKEGDTGIDHSDYRSYQSLEEGKKPTINHSVQRGYQIKGKFNFQKKAFRVISKAGLFGIVDDEQLEIIPNDYKNIACTNINKGFLILQNESFHLFDLNSKTFLLNNLEDIYFNAKYKLYIFTKDDKKGIVDPDTRQIVVPAKYNHVQAAVASSGLDRKIILLYDGKGIDFYYKTKNDGFHYVDNHFQSITTFSLPKNNYAIVKKDGITELLSLDSLNSIFTFKNFQKIMIAPSMNVFIKSDDSWAIYKNNFEAINPGKFEDFNYENSGDAHIAVKQNGLWGAIDRWSLDSLIIPCKYDSISYAIDKMYKTYDKKGKVGLINYNNEVLAPTIYEAIYTQYALRGKFWVKENGKFRLPDGEKINLFDKIIKYFNQNFYIVENEGKQGLYSEKDNQMIIPCKYDSVYEIYNERLMKSFRNGIALQKDNDIFISDLKGKMMSDYAFKSIIKLPTDCELIIKDHNGKSHIISNCEPQFELPSPVDSIRHVEPGTYVIANDGKFGFFSSGSYLEYQVRIPMEYEEILWYLDKPADGSKLIMAKKEGKWRWINPETGKNNFEYVFDKIDQFYDGRQSNKAKVVLDGKKKFFLLNGTLENRKY